MRTAHGEKVTFFDGIGEDCELSRSTNMTLYSLNLVIHNTHPKGSFNRLKINEIIFYVAEFS